MDDPYSTVPPADQNDSTSDVIDHILANLLRDLEGVADRDRPAIVDRYCALYPEHAAEIRATIATMMMVGPSRAESNGHVPDRLGDFRIVRKLARGGMGDIFEAVQEPLGRRVAVKTIRDARLASSPDIRGRFLREQTVLARLHHTHIVPIHAAGQEGPLHYFAMPYIEGAALSHVVESAREFGPRPGSTPTLAELAAHLSTTRYDPPAPTPPAPTRPPGAMAPEPHPLPLAYFRSVARVLADAADAVQHAHEAAVLHRDLKPSNLMVDHHEHCWVVDFGLARYRESTLPAPLDPALAADAASGQMGTPLYMAPEQFDRRADERTDVWGLGVTLYELFTLHRAFSSPAQIKNTHPKPPRAHVPNLPPDLEAICLKALRKDPAGRYPTARSLAADLRHWLNHEPVEARPAPAVRKVALWSRRNKGWAAAIAVAVFAVVGVGLGVAYFLKHRADAARAGELTQRRESLMQQIVRIRLTPHLSGWFEQAWGLVTEAARIRKDDRLQSEATGILTGLDATQILELPGGATSVLFDRDGKRLFIGGTAKGLLVWDGDRTERQDQSLNGPFALRPDGTPVQLGPTEVKKRGRLVSDGFPLRLWSVSTAQVDRTFADPIEGGSASVTAWSISPDASRVGASVMLSDDKRVLVVWDADSGEILLRIDYPASGLAFSPDASLLAAWDEAGHIDLWNLADGERVMTLSAGSNPVRAVAFGPNHWRRGDPTSPAGRWLLAAGEAGGTVTVWDLQLKVPRAICRGSQHNISALAFSPDGLTLAAGGHLRVKLWDVATGQFLLDMYGGGGSSSLSYSPDGSKLATATPNGEVRVWELEDGRGIRTLRGLTAQAEKAIFSPDGNLVAGLSQDWRVAIWDRVSGRLRRMLDIPQGDWADNSGLAFSPDGRRFAFSAGRLAKLWDIETGRELGRWDLPPGFQDTLAFQGPDRLVLLRTETKDGKVRPYGSGSDPRDHPRVCPLRELQLGNTTRTITTITDFNWHLHDTRVSPDGKYFLLEGLSGPKGQTRTVNAYDANGERLWVFPSQLPRGRSSWMRFDPSGKVFFLSWNQWRATLHEMPTRALLADFERGVLCIGPGGTRWAGGPDAQDPTPGTWVAERGRDRPLVKIPTTGPSVSLNASFSPDGHHLAWANPDGTITLCNLPEIQRRLAGVGMGW